MKDVAVSVVVSAYNEEKTIERVVDDLLKISFLNEIIIIDDGSKDDTKNILEKIIGFPKIQFIFNKKNQGKGYSIARGLEISKSELILILDADIINYTESDLKLLVNPVLNGECDYTMKMTDNTKTKFTSGVRVYWKKDLVPLLNEMKNTTRYGLEVMLNKYLVHKKGKFVTLRDYKHFQKFEKYPLPQAMWEYLKEGVSILMQVVKQ
jgi:glycosyltransferase involved in cell wall biosynthesis